jgi:anti-sigma B factor antagonist
MPRDMDTSEEFECTVSQQGDRAVMHLRGELDAATGPGLSAAVAELTTDGLAGVVVDLEHVTFVDSRGLSALLESHRTATDRDMTLTAVNLQPSVARLFRITGVDAVLLDSRAST